MGFLWVMRSGGQVSLFIGGDRVIEDRSASILQARGVGADGRALLGELRLPGTA